MWGMPRFEQNDLADSMSREGTDGDNPVTASILFPSASKATAVRTAESTPPEKAITALSREASLSRNLFKPQDGLKVTDFVTDFVIFAITGVDDIKTH